MVKLSVAIAAHPHRFKMAKELWDRLGSPPDLRISWDEGDDEWETHRKAWELHDPSATHHLVLQDDALPCQDLLLGLTKALEWVPPQSPVSLYFGNALNHPKIKRAANTADETKASWIISSGTWWGVGIILPTSMIVDMLRFCWKRREVYDRRMSLWCSNNHHVVYYPWPSLVEHRDSPSLVNPGRRPGRTAYKFVGENFSALEWNPTGPTVQCGRIGATTLTLGR